MAAFAAIAGTLALGNWQTRRAEEKRALQSQYDAAETVAPALLSTANDLAAVASQLPRRVRLTGEFVEAATVYIDNRIVDGVAGMRVITALRTIADAPLVLIDRGWAARDIADRARLPAIATSAGTVTIEGLAVARLPRSLELGATSEASLGLWQNLDYERFERATGRSVARMVVQQTGGPSDGLRRDRLRLDAGVDRHRGYAVQWYSLAGLILLLTLYYGVRARRAS